MNKEASDLLRMALLGLLTGSGAYGAMRLARDIPNAAKGPEKPKNELELTLPSARIPKTAEDEHSAIKDYLLPLLAGGGGVVGGFLGTSKIYSTVRQKELKDKEKAVEDNYLHTLQQAHQKVAEFKTPHIDEFLTGLVGMSGETFNKTAWVPGGVDMPSEGPIDMITHGGKAALHGLADTSIGSGAIAAWLVATLGAGGATYAIANKMDKQKQHNRDRTTLPSEIKLSVAH